MIPKRRLLHQYFAVSLDVNTTSRATTDATTLQVVIRCAITFQLQSLNDFNACGRTIVEHIGRRIVHINFFRRLANSVELKFNHNTVLLVLHQIL